jgi:hypothetical protein
MSDIEKVREKQQESAEDHHAPGTLVLALVLLGSFAIYYFANWKALADVWHVR